MTLRWYAPLSLLLPIFLGSFSVAVCAQDTPAQSSQNNSVPAADVAPVYDSKANAGRSTASRSSSPEDDGRPGEYYFGVAANALQHKNYRLALDMYKVAASWAYKPAEYNLGVMYLRGQGVPIDLPRAMAWMTLAAERNEKQYVLARDLLNAKLTDAQFAQADLIWGQLKSTYGDEVALHRAEMRWAEARSSMTGSRVGSTAGELAVSGGSNMKNSDDGPGGSQNVATSGFGIIGGNQTDGSVAYSQLLASKNPYDPKFRRDPEFIGKVTVEPLIPVKNDDEKGRAASNNPSDANTSGH